MFQKRLRPLAVVMAGLVLATLPSAHADPITVTGSGVFDSLPGYGYEYDATWEATAGSFTFTPFIAGDNRFFSVGGSFSNSSSLLDVTSLDFNAVVNFRLLNLTTGALEVPASLRFHGGGGQADYRVTPSPSELRFSNPIETTTFAITNTATGAPLPAFTFLPPVTAVTFRVSEHFVAGNFLLPSADPGCASFSCMIPGHDVLQIVQAGTFTYTASQIPEPGTFGLMLAGAALLAGAARRKPR